MDAVCPGASLRVSHSHHTNRPHQAVATRLYPLEHHAGARAPSKRFETIFPTRAGSSVSVASIAAARRSSTRVCASNSLAVNGRPPTAAAMVSTSAASASSRGPCPVAGSRPASSRRRMSSRISRCAPAPRAASPAAPTRIASAPRADSTCASDRPRDVVVTGSAFRSRWGRRVPRQGLLRRRQPGPSDLPCSRVSPHVWLTLREMVIEPMRVVWTPPP